MPKTQLEELQEEAAEYRRRHPISSNDAEVNRRREKQAVDAEAPRADHLITDEEAEKIRRGMRGVK